MPRNVTVAALKAFIWNDSLHRRFLLTGGLFIIAGFMFFKWLYPFPSSFPAAVFAINAAFSILASSNVFRYQVFALVTGVFYLLLTAGSTGGTLYANTRWLTCNITCCPIHGCTCTRRWSNWQLITRAGKTCYLLS